MTEPFVPGGAPAPSPQAAFTTRSLASAGVPGARPFVPRSHASPDNPDRPDYVPRSLASAGVPEQPAFVPPVLSPPVEPERPAFTAPALSVSVAQAGHYGLPDIAPNLFGAVPHHAEHTPEPKQRDQRLRTFTLWTAVIGLLLAGLGIGGTKLFLIISGMTAVPDLSAAEAADRCQDALTNEVNRGLQAALVADRRIKSNLLTGVEVGEPKAVDGGFDVAGTGRFTVATAKKKNKPGKVLLTCMVRRDGAGQIVTTVTTK